MTRTLNLLPFDSPHAEPNQAFNILIAYEDFEAGKHAKKTYDYLVEKLGADCRFTNQMWKFEVLSIPNLREMVAKDAAKADIVMISCRGVELPPEVKAWIELWVAEPHRPFALVALFDSPPSEPTPFRREVHNYLASVAKRGEMEFFAQPDEWAGGKQADAIFEFPRCTDPKQQSLFVLASPGQRETSFPHWGINE